MSDDREPYSAAENETFGHIDDEEPGERPLEEEILDAEDYAGADRHGTTPAEEQRGVPLDEYLEQELPDRPEEAVTDEWQEGPDPRAGTLADSFDVYAEEHPRPAEDAGQGEVHRTEDELQRDAELREESEGGPPLEPEEDEPRHDKDPDLGPEPGPDDWRE